MRPDQSPARSPAINPATSPAVITVSRRSPAWAIPRALKYIVLAILILALDRIVGGLSEAALRNGWLAPHAVEQIGSFYDAYGPGLMLRIGLAVLVLAIGSLGFLDARQSVYVLTETHLRIRHGVLNRREANIDLRRIQDIQGSQPIWLAPFGAGHIDLITSDTAESRIRLIAVRDYATFRDRILEASRRQQAQFVQVDQQSAFPAGIPPSSF
jgi:membrane protein YdbS with pleckstrin-like domain